MKLSRNDLLWLRRVLQEDLKDRSRSIKLCNQGTNDEVLAERIEVYNNTKDLLERVEDTIDKIASEGHTSTEVAVVGDDDMYTV